MQIPLAQLPSTSLLIRDYLQNSKQVKPLYHRFFSLENIQKQSLEKQENYTHRNILIPVLNGQMQTLELSEFQKTNLKTLEDANTFTVTTGHQLNIFTGPLYFIYKISQTIKTVEELNKNVNDFKYVPIFWMATEDHDFEEINHCNLNGKKISWHTEQNGAVGRFHLKGFDEVLSCFLEVLKHTKYHDEIQEITSLAYHENFTLAQATRKIVHALFKDQGLLILDADEPELKKLMIPYFKEELLDENLYSTTTNTREYLKENNYKIQVNPRKINLFYLNEHSRNRIIKKDGVFKVMDSPQTFTEKEILKELQTHPERFSPNAVARPLYQEVILPNIMYIGGNAEIAYWLELKQYFENNLVPLPILMPRNSILYLSENQNNKLQKLKLGKDQLTLNSNVLERVIIENFSTMNLEMEEKIKRLKNIYQDLKEKSKKTDKTLSNLLDAEMQKQLNSFKRIEKRLLKAEKKVHKDKMAQFQHLYNSIYPDGKFQERHDNFFQFYQYYGKDFLSNIYETITYKQAVLNIKDI